MRRKTTYDGIELLLVLSEKVFAEGRVVLYEQLPDLPGCPVRLTIGDGRTRRSARSSTSQRWLYFAMLGGRTLPTGLLLRGWL